MALPPAGPIPQPKILTAFTVPTGGWQFKLYLSNAADYDKPVTVTIPAGDYFIAWDAQSDDFLWELSELLNTAITALGGTFAAGGGAVVFKIDATTHKVVFGFDGPHYRTVQKRKVKLAWTELDGDEVASKLGFDNSADDISTAVNSPTFTADWHHSHGWYADDDGLLDDDLTEDESMPEAAQSVAPSGHVKTMLVADRFLNRLGLVFLPRIKSFSKGVGYGETPLYPYEKNEPLECWWREAMQGRRFRVYRDGQIDITKAVDRNTSAYAGDGVPPITILTDSGKAWETDPKRWTGRILYQPAWSLWCAFPQRWYIDSNTATTITVANQWQPGYDFNENATSYYILEQTYRTYVLDLEKTKSFAPHERTPLDLYDFAMNLLRYES